MKPLTSPADMRPEIIVPAITETEPDYWVPQADGVWFRPLCFGVSQGFYVNLLRVRKAGILSRHRHTGPVQALVLQGSWRYLEHPWTAHPGGYVMETPGETHTLIVPDGVEEMVTWFHVTGGYVYLDEDGKTTGYEDVFTKLDCARAHYKRTGLPLEMLNALIR